MLVTKQIQSGEHTAVGIALPVGVADAEFRGKTFADAIEELGFDGWSDGSNIASAIKPVANRIEEIEKLKILVLELLETWVGEVPVSCEHEVFVAHNKCEECEYE